MKDGNAALHLAAIHGCEPCVHVLIKSGADVEFKNEVRCCSDLCFCCYCEYFAQDGHTAVYLAWKHGHASVINTLVLAGADASNLDMVMFSKFFEI